MARLRINGRTCAARVEFANSLIRLLSFCGVTRTIHVSPLRVTGTIARAEILPERASPGRSQLRLLRPTT